MRLTGWFLQRRDIVLIVRYEINSYVLCHFDEVCALYSFKCFTVREQNRVRPQCNGITSDTYKYTNMTDHDRRCRLISLRGLYSGPNIEARTEYLDSVFFLWFSTEPSCNFRDKQSNYAHPASFQLPFSFIPHLHAELLTALCLLVWEV
jgi:hypothetical protein